MIRHLGLGVVLGSIVLGLSACGGGSSGATSPRTTGGPAPPTSSGPDVWPGAVTVRVMTESGTPIPDVAVALNGSFDGRALDTDAEGWARFSNVNSGEASIHTFARGFHGARRRFIIESDTVTELSVILMRATEATPVVLGTHASPSEDGHTLTVDVDVAVLGEDGLANPTLTAADFAVANSDCAFMWCVMDASGQPLPSGGYYAHVETEAFGWHEASTDPPPTSGTALLLEQSTRLIDFDPGRRRSTAIYTFLDSVTAPDTVSVASYHGTPQAPVLTTYGPFTSDGALFRDDVDTLSDDDASLNPTYAVLADMLSWTATQATSGPDDPRSVVLVSGGLSWPDDDRHSSRLAVAETSRALGISIVAIGEGEASGDIAARSGGPSVVVTDPEQYAVALGNLKSIVARRLGYNRVRVVLDAGAVYGPQTGRVFQSGHTVWAYTQAHIGPDTWVGIPVVILIP
jgi:hypothetical protein